VARSFFAPIAQAKRSHVPQATHGSRPFPRQGAARVGVALAPRRIGGIVAPLARHSDDALGPRVVGLHRVVAERPACGGVADDLGGGLEVPHPEPQGHPTVEDRGPAHARERPHHVLLASREHAVGSVEGVVGREGTHAFRAPVVGSARDPVAPLDHQDAPARAHQLVGGHRSAESAADDHGVVLGDRRSPAREGEHHSLPCTSASSRGATVAAPGRWLRLESRLTGSGMSKLDRRNRQGSSRHRPPVGLDPLRRSRRTHRSR
jgi:hypothetical protein